LVFVPPPPVPATFVGVLFVATAEELASGAASVCVGAAVGGAVSSGGGVVAAVGVVVAGVSTGGGPLEATTNTPTIAAIATTAPIPMYIGVRFFWGFAGSGVETVGAAVAVTIWDGKPSKKSDKK